MKHIKEEAFGGCENLHTVILEGQTVLDLYCFTRRPRLTKISMLSGMAEYYKECKEEHWYYYIIEYFHHTGKEDILTPKKKKYLDDFLKEESKKTSVTRRTGNTLCLCGTTATQERHKWMKLRKCWITRN